MHIDPKKISVDLGVTGIAEIPNQHHHEVRRTHHVINIALIGINLVNPFLSMLCEKVMMDWARQTLSIGV